jgi:hypothetical protein
MGKYTISGPAAYQLYKEGSTLEEISEITGVSVTTLSGWSQKYDWPAKREMARKTAGALYETLASKFAEGVRDMPVPELMGKFGADAVSKVASALHRLGGVDDFPSQVVTVLDDMSKWVSSSDKPDEVKEARMEMIQEYFAYVKERAFPKRG